MQVARHSNPAFLSKQVFTKGRDIWRDNLHVTVVAADRIRSSLGPNGACKMIVYNRGPEKIVKITKDPVTVLEELAIQYPSLAIFAEAAKMHRQEIGDGVASFAIFTSALLKKADELITKGVHPTIILDGYLEAAKRALEIIEATSEKLEADRFDDVLETVNCGRNLLTAEIRRMLIEATEFTTEKGKLDKERIRMFRKTGGATAESKLVKGVIVKKAKLQPSMPYELVKPRIAVTSGRIGMNRLELKMRGEGPFHMKFDVASPEQLVACQEAEKERKHEALEQLRKLNVNVLFCQQPINDYEKNQLCQMGVLAFQTVNREDCALIAKATHSNIVSSLAELHEADVGAAEKLETEKWNHDEIVTLAVPNYATFMLRGSTLQAFEELELLARSAVTLLKLAIENGRAVPSGGAMEMRIARKLRDFSLEFSGRKQLAIGRFAEALMEIPRCLAENNGVNPEDAIIQLNKLHAEGFSDYGINPDGSCGAVCVELSEVKSSIIKRAYEVASLMLRVNEQIKSKEIVKFHKKQ
jgi:chaperonin GroEL (HSP60 family)